MPEIGMILREGKGKKVYATRRTTRTKRSFISKTRLWRFTA